MFLNWAKVKMEKLCCFYDKFWQKWNLSVSFSSRLKYIKSDAIRFWFSYKQLILRRLILNSVHLNLSLTHHSGWVNYSVPRQFICHWATVCHVRKILFMTWVKVMRLWRRCVKVIRRKSIYTVIDKLLVVGLSVEVCHFLNVMFIWRPSASIQAKVAELLRRNLGRTLSCRFLYLLYCRCWRFSLDCCWLGFALSPLLLLVLLSKLRSSVFKPHLGN